MNTITKTNQKTVSVGPLTLRFITLVIVAVLCVLYLAQSTQGAAKNYKVWELEQRKVELEKENERLQVDATRLQTLQNIDINKDGQNKDFTDSTKVEYIR